jgi:hypothetical protein
MSTSLEDSGSAGQLTIKGQDLLSQYDYPFEGATDLKHYGMEINSTTNKNAYSK